MKINDKDIGSRIKELREISDIQIEKIAIELNVDKEDYMSYESGEKSIPVSILYEISQKFKVDMGVLLTGKETRLHIYNVTRKGKGASVKKRKFYITENLGEKFIHKKIEAFIVTVDPNVGKPELIAHHGQEFNYVLEGSFKLYIYDNQIILNEGDSIFFDSTYKHGMEALNDKKAKFLAIIT